MLAATIAWLALGAQPGHAQEHPLSFGLAPARVQVRPGGTAELTLRASIPPGWHLYSVTQEPGGPIPTTISVGPAGAFRLGGSIDATVPRSALDPNFGMVTETYDDSAVFRFPVRVQAASGRHGVEVVVAYQTCNNRYCLPPTEDTLRTVALVAGEPVSGPGGALQQATSPPNVPAAPAGSPASAGAPVLRAETARAPAAADARAQPAASPARESRSARGFIAFLWLAAVMGALSLLTPCVFPMVPITISYFSRGEQGSRARAVGDAFLYAGGIVGAFTALGLGFALLAGVAGMNRFAANPVLNLAIAALFCLFAFSLFGLLEIALPPRAVNWLYRASSGSRFGRIGTTLLMGVTFAVTTFTCTAPFVGTLLVSAASGDWRWPAAGLLAFSAVFALPFLVLALVPRAVAKLPKSGQWLATVKATLGFIELAAAFKFISNADLVLGWHLFTRDVVLAAWMLIFLALALYLGGVRPKRPFVTRSRYPLAGLAAAVLVVWLGTGVGGRRLGELDSFLPPATTTSGAQAAGELPWLVDDYDGALADARSNGLPVLIDFTGYTCTNCRWMEANMFPRPDVARELEQFVRVRLFTDGRSELNREQQALEQEKFGTVALPLYAVVDGQGATRGTFLGMTRDAAEFIEFLNGARTER